MPATLRKGVCCCLFAFSTLQADERTFGPKELVTELLQRNPEIRAAQYRFEAATKRPSQVSTLPDPKLTLVNVGVGQPFSRLNVSEFAYRGIGVSHEIPFPGKLALAGEEAGRETDSEQEDYS